MRKLLLALLIAVEPAGCYELAHADTVTIGYFDPAAVDANLGIKVLATTTAPVTTMSPIILQTGLPIFLGGNPANPSTQFGFDAIGATVIPPGGNVISGGIPGAVLPTFEFFFNDGFVPPSGGSIYLYATWQGTLDAHGVPSITLPTQWGTDEMPKNAQGLTVTTQVLVCNTPNPFCGPFVGGISSFAGQDQFANQLRVGNITLSAVLPGVGIESPNTAFKITEVFAFTGAPGPFGCPTCPPQGDVGAFIMTTPVPVPAPIVGTGPAAGLVGAFMLWLARRRRNRCKTRAT